MKRLDFGRMLREMRRTYFGNATATRDQRIQLRGSKAVVLFTLYLVLMAFVLFIAYESALGESGRSLATAQTNLQSFYYTTLGCLGVMLTIVAPAVGAFAIVTEKQRRSLDLVFSAPVEPKYYLVGKLISAYRYVWLLLILALPFCAVSVTLGGATWIQLLITFVLFSMYGLVCVAAGLVLSALSQKPIPALCWTYVGIGGYWMFTGILMSVSAASSGGSPFANVTSFMSLCPLTFPFQGGQSTPVFGVSVPVWIVSIVLHLLVVKIVILGAGSIMSNSDRHEVKSLRLHGIVYCFLISALGGWSLSMLSRFASSGSTFEGVSPADYIAIIAGRVFDGVILLVGLFLVPYLSAFGINDFRRFRYDANFKLRNTFTSAVSGNLPFLILFFATALVGTLWGTSVDSGRPAIASMFSGSSIGARAVAPQVGLNTLGNPWFGAYILHGFSMWLIMWITGMITSARHQSVSRARTISLFSIVILVLVPTFILSIVAPEQLRSAEGLWTLNPITGLFCELKASSIVVVHTAILFALFILGLFVFRTLKPQSLPVSKIPNGVPQ